MKRQQVLGTAGPIMLLACTAMALPPTGSQCAGYSYSRSLSVARSEDKLSVVAVSMIGGFNPCSFRTAVQLTSPTGRTASGVDGYNYSYNASNAQATATLAVQTDGGTYSATSQYGVQDDTVYPMQYYTPSSSSAQTTVSDPTPTISSISPDTWRAGATTAIQIAGSGFGTNPVISSSDPSITFAVNHMSSNDTLLNATVTVPSGTPPEGVTVTVASNRYSGGFLPGYPGQLSQVSAMAIITLHSFLVCGDARDLLINEYYVYGKSYKPVCSDFTQTASSTYYSFSDFNRPSPSQPVPAYSWAIVRTPLTVDASAGYGLSRWITLIGGVARNINSGYRCPSQNAAAGGAPESAHLYGRAVDLQTYSQADWTYVTNKAIGLGEPPTGIGAAYVEPSTGPCGYACAHAHWQ